MWITIKILLLGLAFAVITTLFGCSVKMTNLDLDIAIAPPHNEPVGPADVARWRIGIDSQIMLTERAGLNLNPEYYIGGVWPDQSYTWSSGEVQRLRLRGDIFYILADGVELYAEKNTNRYVHGKSKAKETPWATSSNKWEHNLFGIRINLLQW